MEARCVQRLKCPTQAKVGLEWATGHFAAGHSRSFVAECAPQDDNFLGEVSRVGIEPGCNCPTQAKIGLEWAAGHFAGGHSRPFIAKCAPSG